MRYRACEGVARWGALSGPEHTKRHAVAELEVVRVDLDTVMDVEGDPAAFIRDEVLEPDLVSPEHEFVVRPVDVRANRMGKHDRLNQPSSCVAYRRGLMDRRVELGAGCLRLALRRLTRDLN